jgi:hypothetical protein
MCRPVMASVGALLHERNPRHRFGRVASFLQKGFDYLGRCRGTRLIQSDRIRFQPTRWAMRFALHPRLLAQCGMPSANKNVMLVEAMSRFLILDQRCLPLQAAIQKPGTD